MKVLEVHFHPRSKKSGSPVTIARVLCHDERTHIEPMQPSVQRLGPFDTDALMRNLRFLVESAKPQPFERLTSLQSEFWSFTEISLLSRTG